MAIPQFGFWEYLRSTLAIILFFLIFSEGLLVVVIYILAASFSFYSIVAQTARID